MSRLFASREDWQTQIKNLDVKLAIERIKWGVELENCQLRIGYNLNKIGSQKTNKGSWRKSKRTIAKSRRIKFVVYEWALKI